MARVSPKGIFPSQAVSDAEKGLDYGLKLLKLLNQNGLKKIQEDLAISANRDNLSQVKIIC